MTDKAIQVLLVEDDPLVKWTCRRTLESLQFSVTEASGCAEGEDLWQSSAFDLIISDYRLGDGLGVEMIGRMRAKGFAQPVICLTAEPGRIPAGTAAELKISAVLGKPVNVEELKNSIRAALQGAAAVPAPSAGQETRVGRFSVIRAPSAITGEFLKSISTRNLGNTWIALDLQQTVDIDEASTEMLLAMASGLAQFGGRLCIVEAAGKALETLKGKGLHKEMDFFGNVEELGPAGRRLTADCERSALFDSVVKEP